MCFELCGRARDEKALVQVKTHVKKYDLQHLEKFYHNGLPTLQRAKTGIYKTNFVNTEVVDFSKIEATDATIEYLSDAEAPSRSMTIDSLSLGDTFGFDAKRHESFTVETR